MTCWVAGGNYSNLPQERKKRMLKPQAWLTFLIRVCDAAARGNLLSMRLRCKFASGALGFSASAFTLAGVGYKKVFGVGFQMF